VLLWPSVDGQLIWPGRGGGNVMIGIDEQGRIDAPGETLQSPFC
jgi:hypothetical protein